MYEGFIWRNEPFLNVLLWNSLLGGSSCKWVGSFPVRAGIISAIRAIM